MKHFLDTSVLISVFWGDHPQHDASLRLFVRANRATSGCGAHSIAELYSVLTRLPLRPPIPPEQALLLIEQIEPRLTIVALDAPEYFRTIRQAASLGVSGGRIYDALLLGCARKARAEMIYTWNLTDFRRIAPDLASRIRTP